METIERFTGLVAQSVQVVGFQLQNWATPIGVVIAALVSFTALFFTNQANIKAEKTRLTETLAAELARQSASLATQRQIAAEGVAEQRRISEEGLAAQRHRSRDTMLWAKRADLYPIIITQLQDRNTVMSEFGLASQPGAALALGSKHISELRNNLSQMQAWTDEPTRVLWNDYYIAQQRFQVLLASYDGKPEGNLPSIKAVFAEAGLYTAKLSNYLITALRQELQGVTHQIPNYEAPAIFEKSGAVSPEP